MEADFQARLHDMHREPAASHSHTTCSAPREPDFWACALALAANSGAGRDAALVEHGIGP
jgi:hypothetical protein